MAIFSDSDSQRSLRPTIDIHVLAETGFLQTPAFAMPCVQKAPTSILKVSMTLSKVTQEYCPPYPAWSIRYHLHPTEGPKKQGDNSIGLNVCKSTPKRCLLHPKTAIQGRKNTQVGWEEQKVNKQKKKQLKTMAITIFHYSRQGIPYLEATS